MLLQVGFEAIHTPADELDLLAVYRADIERHRLLTAEQEVDLAKTVEVGVYVEHLLAERQRRPDPELQALVDQGRAAKERLVNANLRLVLHLARQSRQHTRYTLLDKVQDGSLGLIRAVEKFDFALGNRFSTYATWWIRQSITRCLADNADVVRKPVHVHDKRHLAETALWFHEPIDIDIAAIDADARAEVMTAAQRLPGDEASLDRLEVRALMQLLANWDERAPVILSLRHGLDAGEPCTLDEIGQIFGLTRERIRQVEKKALLTLGTYARVRANHGHEAAAQVMLAAYPVKVSRGGRKRSGRSTR